MTTSHRRIALLTGASITALGLAMPAYAAPHDTLADGTYPGVADTNVPASAITETLVICEIADDLDTIPDSP
jgi:hypothetical protein